VHAPSVLLTLVGTVRPMTNTPAPTSTPGFFASPQAFSSATDDWATPQATFDELNKEFDFGLDVCASLTNRKCTDYFGLDHTNAVRRDGLRGAWAVTAAGKAVWLNPPYGRTIGGWMKKAMAESDAGATVVCLVPARTDTAWFQDTALVRMRSGRAEIRFVRGRLKFGGQKNAAPFPSAVVVFYPPAE
jgi:site-specific DNA-methyltransferase (adenine-specific)